MKQSIQLKLGQSLTMTPQLQQAIRLLQLSSLELNVEIQDALDSNMMLELAEERDGAGASHNNEVPTNGENASSEHRDEVAAAEAMSADDYPSGITDQIPEDLPVDSQWDDIYDGVNAYQAGGVSADGGAKEFDNFRSAEATLRDHLLWQINLMPLTETDRLIAFLIIDNLNEDGYLESSVEEIQHTLVSSDMLDIEEDEVEAVLKQVQYLDPVGVGARDLRECLLLQLAQLDPGTPWLPEARRICETHLSALATHDYGQLMRRVELSQDELLKAVNLIQSLNPKPGAQFNDKPPEYVVPDVFVHKEKGRWKVELNVDTIPRLRVNPYYAGMIKRADNSPDNNALKQHMQEAKWFIKSLQSRSDTLLRVATSIVERQQAFLEHGEEAMKPLVLRDIADVLGMHESTISRVTTRKYMHTPRGIYELKFFFSSHVGTALGGEASSTAIRAVIKKFIAAENVRKPLSDSRIAGLLSEQGINVARRTVAKYREAMSIPPSNERKRLA